MHYDHMFVEPSEVHQDTQQTLSQITKILKNDEAKAYQYCQSLL